jgi:hypothetical protein
MINNDNSELKVTSVKTCRDCGRQHSLVSSYCGHSHGKDIFAVGIVRAPRSGRQSQLICPDLPLAIQQDDIVRGQIDVAAVRQREEAERKRLIVAIQKRCPPAPKCDHGRPVKTHTFSDGKVLKLYGCGCSNGPEILNGWRTNGK